MCRHYGQCKRKEPLLLLRLKKFRFQSLNSPSLKWVALEPRSFVKWTINDLTNLRGGKQLTINQQQRSEWRSVLASLMQVVLIFFSKHRKRCPNTWLWNFCWLVNTTDVAKRWFSTTNHEARLSETNFMFVSTPKVFIFHLMVTPVRCLHIYTLVLFSGLPNRKRNILIVLQNYFYKISG